MTRPGVGLAALVVLAVLGAPPAGADHAWAPVLSIDPDSARSLMDRGERVQPVDLRPETAFRAGRLPQARSLPLSKLRERADEVPQRGVVILYCGCPRDELLRAYQFLRGRRHTNVYVLEGGIDAWVRLGHPLER